MGVDLVNLYNMPMSQNTHLVMSEDHMENLYHSKNPLVRYVHMQRLQMATKYFPDTDNLKVLDAGCGEGHLLAELHLKKPHNTYYGVDVTEVALQKALGRCPFATLTLNDVTALPFDNNFFDVVIATETLEHIIEYEKAIAELKRVLKPNGVLMVTFPNEILWTFARFLLGRKPLRVPDHVNSFTPRIMRRSLGLALISQRNLPFPLPFFLSLGSLMCFRKKEMKKL